MEGAEELRVRGAGSGAAGPDPPHRQPGAAVPAVIWRVRSVVDDPGEGIFSRPVAVCEWSRMAWNRSTAESSICCCPTTGIKKGSTRQASRNGITKKCRDFDIELISRAGTLKTVVVRCVNIIRVEENLK